MNTFLRTLIIDDEERAIIDLEYLLKNHKTIKVVAHEKDSEKAVQVIENFRPDLIFLDIHMPGKTGFEITDEIFKDGFKPEIIFVTAFDKYAIEAIRHAAFDFLLKPVKPDELSAAIDRLFEKRLQQDREQQIKRLLERVVNKGKLKITTTGGFTLINPADILYIQADWNYSEIYFNGEKNELVTMNIGALEEMLPTQDFFRLNRSIIINLANLLKVSRKKRIAYLVKDNKEYTFKIPLLNIRKLERFLER